MNIFLLALILLILILLNALYVAAEFSTVSARKSRLAQISDEGNNLAGVILGIVEDPAKLDTYVAACQLGITVTSLLVGFFGQPRLTAIVAPLFSSLGGLSNVAAQSVSATTVLLTLTAVQVVIGELVPKNIGIQYPERLALLTAVPMRWSVILFRPLIWLFNGSGQVLMRLFGQDMLTEHAHIHAPDEILLLVEESGKGGLLRREERRLLKNTLQMRDSIVREVMIPRPHMLTAPDNSSSRQLFDVLTASPYSRLPVYRGSIDNIVGVVHLKDLLCVGGDEEATAEKIIKSVPFVPETTPIKTVFSLLQRRHLQVAIVLDEYGGTAGMVTLEDLIEEIFGELQDEFDTYIPSVRIISDEKLWIRGATLVSDLNQWFDMDLPDENVDTIGGLVLNSIGHVPTVGEEVNINRATFQVAKMRGRGITAVLLAAKPEYILKVREGVS